MSDAIEALPGLWDWTWRTSLHVCVLVCVIRVVQLLFRNVLTPRWHYALWMLVLIRMIMPIGMEAPWSVFNLFKTEIPVTASQSVTPLPAYDWVMVSMTQPVYSAPTPSPVQTEFDPAQAFSFLWLAGIALLTLHLLRQWANLRKQVSIGKQIDSPEVLSLMDACSRAIGVKTNHTRIKEAGSNGSSTAPPVIAPQTIPPLKGDQGGCKGIPIIECAIPVPGLYGFLRPKLLMPHGLTQTLTKDELRFILLHELAHYKRHDLTVNWLMTLMQLVHWFNPLVWYAFMRMRTDRELACDALALSHAHADDPEAYGKCLLKLMDQNHGLRPVPGMIGILENHAHLKRRIIAIARFTTTSYKWSIPALLILALIGSITLTQAVQEEIISETNPASTVLKEETSQQEITGRVPIETDDGEMEWVPIVEGDSTDSTTLLINNSISTEFSIEKQYTGELTPPTSAKPNVYQSYSTSSYADRENLAQNQSTPTQPDPELPNKTDQSTDSKDETILVMNDLANIKEGHQYRDLSDKEILKFKKLILEYQPEAKNKPTPTKTAETPSTNEVPIYTETDLYGVYGTYTPVYLQHKDLPADKDPLRQLVEGEYRDAELASVISKLAQKAEIDVIASTDLSGIVTVNVKPTPLGRLIETILEMHDLGIVEEMGIYRITTLKDATEIRTKQASGELPRGFTLYNKDLPANKDPLRKLVNIEFTDMDLENTLHLLAEKGKITIINPDEFSGKVTANLDNIPVGRAIEVILRMNSLSIIKEDKHYRITPYKAAIVSNPRQELIDVLSTISDANPAANPEKPLPVTLPTHKDPVKTHQATEPESKSEPPKLKYPENVEVRGSIRIAKKAPAPSEALNKKLNQLVGLVFEDTHLSNFTKVLEKNYEITINIDNDVVAPKDATSSEGYITDGTIDYINLKGVTLRQALNAILRPLNLTFIPSGDSITITSFKKYREARPQVSNQQHLTSRRQGIQRILDTRITLQTKDMHIKEILEHISDKANINLMLDNRVVAPLQPPDAQPEEPYVTNGIVSGEKNHTEETVRHILDDLLKPLGLAHSIQAGFIWITSPEKLKHESFEPLETHYYEISEPLRKNLGIPDVSMSVSPQQRSIEDINFRLRGIVPRFRDPISKKELSSIAYNPETRQLLVNNTPENHTKFLEYFKRPIFRKNGKSPKIDYTVFTPLSSDSTNSTMETRAYTLPKSIEKKLVRRPGEPGMDKETYDKLTAIMYAKLDKIMPNILEPVTKKSLSFAYYNVVNKQLIVHQTPENHQRFQHYINNPPVTTNFNSENLGWNELDLKFTPASN